jgi:RNA polymerase sigma-70 factor (ECF subfamily)
LVAEDSATKGRELARSEIETLIAQNYHGLRLIVTQRAGDPQLAADLLNEAIETAWRKWQAGKIARPQEIAGYVFETAMNLLRNHRRKSYERVDRRIAPSALEVLDSGARADRGSIEAEIVSLVRSQIANLSMERDRDVVLRFYLKEEEKADICREMKLDPLHFDKIIFRARRRLRELLEQRGFSKHDLICLCLA